MTTYLNIETSDVPTMLKELNANGFKFIAARAAQSWEGRPPETLVIASIEDWSTQANDAVRRICANHNQDCAAVRFSPNVGKTIGSKPVAYNESYFQTE